MTRPVTVTIDVLAVAGLDAAQARAFGDALERELTRLMTAGGAVPERHGRDAGPAASGDIALRTDRPDRAADLIARAIYRRVAG